MVVMVLLLKELSKINSIKIKRVFNKFSLRESLMFLKLTPPVTEYIFSKINVVSQAILPILLLHYKSLLSSTFCSMSF